MEDYNLEFYMNIIFKLFAGVFLGWSLGSNDAANVFGTAVANNIIKYSRAAIILSIFVLLGALLQGQHGFETLGKIANLSQHAAIIACFSAAVTVTAMTFFGLPVSTSQAVVGAILGIGISQNSVEFAPLKKIFAAWLLTPIGAAVIALILYNVIGYFLNKIKSAFLVNRILLIGFYIVGIYGAYALGANNVANVTGIYVSSGMLTPFWGALIGGLSIALGACTYGKNVMMTVGKDLIPLSHFSAFIAIFAQAITVHIYAMVGVPVSTSQAIVGAVLGIGLATGTKTINVRTLLNILYGWLSTPTISGIMSYGIFVVYNLIAGK